MPDDQICPVMTAGNMIREENEAQVVGCRRERCAWYTTKYKVCVMQVVGASLAALNIKETNIVIPPN